MKKKLLVIILLFLVVSCKTEVNNQAVIYTNDFEGRNLAGITNGIIEQFNGSAVLGRYNIAANKGYFTLQLNNLAKHDIVIISFDLYIHDGWDGNKVAPDGPDIWQMLVDGSTYINTTFSNDSCPANNFCSPQSYPYDYPNNYYNPKFGAYRIDLPGVCHFTGPNGTTQYKITKTFRHSSNTLLLQCLDKLVQTNSPDPKCDESWSVDNIKIEAVTL